MRSIVQDEYGRSPQDVLRLAEVDKPTTGEDDVLVRVHAASVDRGTWQRDGWLALSDSPGGIRSAQTEVRQPGPEPCRNRRSRRCRGDRLDAGRRRVRYLRRLLRRV